MKGSQGLRCEVDAWECGEREFEVTMNAYEGCG